MSKLRASGGYRSACSFQTATLVYDATYWFCVKFLDSRSRTVDQMVQAARSGRQNISEGSRAAATSSQSEQLAAARLVERQKRTDPLDSSAPIPACPKCGKPTVLRTAKTGKNAGQQFWGCTAFPACKGIVKLRTHTTLTPFQPAPHLACFPLPDHRGDMTPICTKWLSESPRRRGRDSLCAREGKGN